MADPSPPLDEEARSFPITALLQKILDDAVEAGVSRLTLVPHDKWSQVLHYVDGEAQEVMTPTKFAYPALSRRLRLLVEADPRNPGAFVHGAVQVRATFQPGEHGDTVHLTLSS